MRGAALGLGESSNQLLATFYERPLTGNRIDWLDGPPRLGALLCAGMGSTSGAAAWGRRRRPSQVGRL